MAELGTVVALIKSLGEQPDPEVIEQAVSDWLDDHPDAACPIDDTAGEGDTDKVWSADKSAEEVETLSSAITTLQTDVHNISPEDTTFISMVHPEGGNLFNKSSATKGKYFDHRNPGELKNDSSMWYEYVPIEGAGNYSYKGAPGFYGSYYGATVVFFDSDKEYVSSIQGTFDNTDNTILHVEVTQAHINSGIAYIGYSVQNSDRSTAMFVKSSTYPSTYIPFADDYPQLSGEIVIPQSIANPLYGKTVVFDGDSICADGESSGWAGRIGKNNAMTWHNTGEGGGTITAGLYYEGEVPRHWVSRYIEAIHSTYSTLDYLILEGGTNDADILADADIGSIDYANWTTFDDTNFVGALESLFYKATSYYPSAKIGFIIPQKMGIDANSGYNTGSSPSARRRRQFFELAIDVCKKWGIPYIDLWEGSPLCPKLTCYYDSTKTSAQNIEAGKAYTDGQHLTDVGYDIITPKIEAWMKTL